METTADEARPAPARWKVHDERDVVHPPLNVRVDDTRIEMAGATG